MSTRGTADAALAFDGVTAGYGDLTALDGVTASVADGVTVVIGPNGAGKTTLFRVGAGVLAPTSGTVRLRGRDPVADPDAKRRVGYLAHGPGLDDRRTVRANLRFWGDAFDLDPDRVAARVPEVSERLGFADLLDRSAGDLSRGQRQRAALGRVLLPDPDVLFLDEPTNGLDPSASRRLRDALDDLAGDRAVLYATHHLAEAAEVGDTVLFLRDGRVVAHDDLDALRERAGLAAGRRVAVKADANAEPVLRSLGFDPVREDEEWLVTLADRDPGDLVSDLVERDVRVRGVRTVETSLADVYERLEAGGRVDA